MNIPFWSNVRKSGTTSSLAAISIMSVLDYQCKITLLENHYNDKNLGRILFPYPRNQLIKENEIYYLGHGITDCFIKQLAKTKQNKAGITIIEVIKDYLDYIPQIPLQRDFFDLSFENNQLFMLKENKKEYWLLDTESNLNVSSKIILDEAELVVVNLKQDAACILDFLKNYSSLINKSIFIISNFVQTQELQGKELLLEYGISKDKITVIPYCEEFQHAAKNGRSVEFITANYEEKQNDSNYNFICAVKMAVKMIKTAIQGGK